MKPLLVALALAAFAVPSFAATCSPTGNCNACKNCRYCKHCSKEGGSCSVCTRRAAEPVKVAKSESARALLNS